jgi:biopolymer transport protein TolQ
METVAVETAAQLAATDFSLWSLFARADIVVKLVMIGLIGASIWSWSIIIGKTFLFRRIAKASGDFEALFWSGKSVQEIHAQLGQWPSSPMVRVYRSAMQEWKRLLDARKTKSAAHGFSDLQFIERTLTTAIAKEMEQVEKRLLFLATLGAVAPFVGLFGTVWGIMNSFQAIAMSKDTNLAVVAPGIAEALFATGLGLLAAIPAVIAYNRFSNDISRLGARLDYFADDFTNLIARQPRD